MNRKDADAAALLLTALETANPDGGVEVTPEAFGDKGLEHTLIPGCNSELGVVLARFFSRM